MEKWLYMVWCPHSVSFYTLTLYIIQCEMAMRTIFTSALELERYWCAFCVKSPSWNACSLFCCCAFCRHTCWLAPRNLPAFTFSFCIFALIDPAHDIFHIASFSAMCCYLNFLADFCWSVSSSKLNWLIFLKVHRKWFSQHMRMRQEWWKICLTVVIHMRTLCKQKFASAERKFNTVISSLDERYIFDQDLHWCKSILRISSEEMLIRKSAAGVLRFWKRKCMPSSSVIQQDKLCHLDRTALSSYISCNLHPNSKLTLGITGMVVWMILVVLCQG